MVIGIATDVSLLTYLLLLSTVAKANPANNTK
jgi:hypothetical protein